MHKLDDLPESWMQGITAGSLVFINQASQLLDSKVPLSDADVRFLTTTIKQVKTHKLAFTKFVTQEDILDILRVGVRPYAVEIP